MLLWNEFFIKIIVLRNLLKFKIMKHLFAEIPSEFKIKSLLHQKTYLVNGELKNWSGTITDVLSTISSTKKYSPTLLGTIPQLGKEEALETLDAAVSAYDK
ncbi:MAG: glyceraldehyde-3-phosphate dehydrogenase (NADP+), partial [Flavobacteriales bacterium]